MAPLAHTPACPDASCTAFTGNANSTGGVTVSGLAPGQYQAAWRLTNTHGDTSSLATTFVVQAGGTNGTNGTNGAAGTNGTNGATGPQGPAGKVELVTCKTITKTVNHKKKTVQVCTTKLVSGVVKFTTSGAVSASLARHGIVYATGAATRTGSRTRLLLTAIRRLDPGRYTLTLNSRHGKRVTTSRQQVTIR